MTALQEFENLIRPNDLNRVFVHLAESLHISRFSLTGLNYAAIFDDDYFQTDFPSMFEYKRWPEIEEELSVGIKLRVGNPSELSLYIGSILNSLAPAARFFFKQSDDDALPTLFEMVNSPYYAAVEIPPAICEIIKKDPQPCVRFQSDEDKEKAGEQAIKLVKESIPGARNDFPFMAASQAYSNLVHVGAYIESVLLECGQKKRLKEYQEEAGVSISDKSLLEQVALVRHWSVEHIEELLKKKGKGRKHAAGHTVGDLAPFDPLDPLYVSKWDSLSLLLVKQYSANQYLLYGGEEPDMEWERMEGEYYDLFDRDVNTLVGDPIRVRQACLVIIQKPLYWFLESNKKRHEYQGDKLEFFVRYYLMLMKYMARVIWKTLSLEPSACFFQLSEELGFSFDDYFNAFVDYHSSYQLGHDPRLFLRFRADQCTKCNKQGCKYRIDDPANYVFGPKGELKRVKKAVNPSPVKIDTKPGEKEYEQMVVDGEVLDALNYVDFCGVKEIDRIFVLDFQSNPQYSKEDYHEDLATFSAKCKRLAESDVSINKKETWIAAVLNVLLESYCFYAHTEKDEYVRYVIGFAAEMDAVFLKNPEQICVKRICQEIGEPFIFDVVDPDVSESGKKYREEDGLDQLTWTESLLFENMGTAVIYHERRLCRSCSIADCKFRFGVRRYFGDVDYNFGSSVSDYSEDDGENGGDEDGNTHILDLPVSERVKEHLKKASSYFVEGHWYNNDRIEYAIFLKALSCKVNYRDWDGYAKWVNIPIMPLRDGTKLTVKQIKGSLRSYKEDVYGGLRKRFEELLK